MFVRFLEVSFAYTEPIGIEKDKVYFINCVRRKHFAYYDLKTQEFTNCDLSPCDKKETAIREMMINALKKREIIKKHVNCSEDYKYYYDKDVDTIFKFDEKFGGIPIFKGMCNNNSLADKRFICDDNRIMVKCRRLPAHLRGTKTRIRDTDYKFGYNIYERWDRRRAIQYKDKKWYNSMLYALMCNKCNFQYQRNKFIPKFVLLLIFDLYF
jgi:hypothetical protein